MRLPLAAPFERRLRNLLAAVLGRLAPVTKSNSERVRAELQNGAIHRLLIVRVQQGLGDALVAMPALQAVCQRFPGLEIDVLTGRRNPEAFRRGLPQARVMPFLARDLYVPWRLLNRWRNLRIRRYDLALVIFSHTPSWMSFCLARLSGARIVWSFDSANFYNGTNWSAKLAHVEISPADHAKPEWKHYATLVEPLVGPLREPLPPPFLIQDLERVWADEWLTTHRSLTRPRVVLFAAGNPAHPGRLPPAEFWAALARRLEAAGYGVVLASTPEKFSYGKSDRSHSMIQAVESRLGKVLPHLQEMSLGRMAAVYTKVDLWVGPDGGMFHVAAASGAPTLGLFWGTSAERWRPPLKNVRVLQMAADSEPADRAVERVYNAISSVSVP